MGKKSEIASIVLGLVGIFAALHQLHRTNSALEAANTISLSRDARSISEQIARNQSDPIALDNAFDLYGDYIAHAGYLRGKNQLPTEIWRSLEKDFCQMLTNQEGFEKWYRRNSFAEHLNSIFPTFSSLDADLDCINQ
ncbi:hypothetical protein EJC49_07200 [Aquibium carbonis]|uniref:Uncharacterized protein n=1 Tax=Aquibium carbonis TaxID=2495581 RepID=A0A429Z006_9HYPH|nr:hypothetical protein [Aquibium carbonis]RST87049.1 hypothetical protein EJC49_07200 [Aquibium carbonis]